ncbi:hypothetical protein M1271_06865 [Patescibacteria group bacterium]|nr:hypothetical protein [Patescibacteria group bacterium]MCL5798460.1 hypothetical protein [Patescibacteria group bacterium]
MGKKIKKIKIGLDFDGVVAYNPFRVVRAPWAFFKNRFLGYKKLVFFYPRNTWQQVFWRILHDSSIFPSKGVNLLRQLVKEGKFEAHLISGRYSFLDDQLNSWLKKNKLEGIFTTININRKDEQPHLFKKSMIAKRKLDFFIEDNWDIVEFLHNVHGEKTKIYWIYNLLDRHRVHKNKFPYLEMALVDIVEVTMSQSNIHSRRQRGIKEK